MDVLSNDSEATERVTLAQKMNGCRNHDWGDSVGAIQFKLTDEMIGLGVIEDRRTHVGCDESIQFITHQVLKIPFLCNLSFFFISK
jgi:hypothetical protein